MTLEQLDGFIAPGLLRHRERLPDLTVATDSVACMRWQRCTFMQRKQGRDSGFATLPTTEQENARRRRTQQRLLPGIGRQATDSHQFGWVERQGQIMGK